MVFYFLENITNYILKNFGSAPDKVAPVYDRLPELGTNGTLECVIPCEKGCVENERGAAVLYFWLATPLGYQLRILPYMFCRPSLIAPCGTLPTAFGFQPKGCVHLLTRVRRFIFK